jgi:hypothetical protein
MNEREPDVKRIPTRAEEFINRIVKHANELHEHPRYKPLKIMIELDERGKLPKVTVRAVPPGVTLRKDERKPVPS